MKLNVLTSNKFVSLGIKHTYENSTTQTKYKEVTFIDVISPPKFTFEQTIKIARADLLVFIVDATSNSIIIRNNKYLESLSHTMVSYINSQATPYEYKELLIQEFEPADPIYHDSIELTKKELNIIDSISKGEEFLKCKICNKVNVKTLSNWKRNIMKKIDVTSDIKLYEVILKCSYVNHKLSSLSPF